MSKRHEEAQKADKPPAEPIYDLTSDDETETVKAASPRERKEEP